MEDCWLEFKASSYRSGWIGLAAAVGLAAGAVVLSRLIISRGEISLQEPLSSLALALGAAILLDLVLLALLIYWSVAALRLHYRLDRNGLIIRWGASRLVVPMERIQAVMPGGELVGGQPIETPDDKRMGGSRWGWRSFRGIGWAGLRAGRARFADGRPVRLFTTSPLAESAVVLTPDAAYVVSPRERDAFVQAWQVRRPLGPTQHWREEEQRGRLLTLPIWRDGLAWTLIGLGLLANLALHIYLMFVFDQLPARLSFHFNVFGQADRIADRTEILRLPQVAFLMLILDLVLGFAIYRGQRVAAYLVWGAGLVLQWLVWGAVITIIG
jgi:hypothetical protein